jgi:imidazole glycerol-phosphate synthase subunit HisF
MLEVRVIPCLLYNGSGLIKTIQFNNPVYIGDATNAIRIFNEKEVDELILLDVRASVKKLKPNLELIKRISSECFMPLCYGGGISSVEDIKNIISVGVEKVSINSKAVESPSFIKYAAKMFGSSTIVVCIDYKKNFWGKVVVTAKGGRIKSRNSPIEFAQLMEDMGAGELVINSIDKDGTMSGYDLDMLEKITTKVNIPVIALGGAGKVEHFFDAYNKTQVAAVAAGSMFVFQGKHKAVLINYPDKSLFLNMHKR